MLPRLHIVTDDAVLVRDTFTERARAMLVHGRERVAFHVRGHHTPTRTLHVVAEALVRAARDTGSTLLVNDRVDVALAVGAHGVQLGKRSLPLGVVRALADWRWVGYSAHAPDEAERAAAEGTDFVLLGTIYRTATHPRAEPGGIERVRATVAQVSIPVLAIGGVTPERIPELMHAGAFGVAVVGGIWSAADPVGRVADYLDGLVANARPTE
jgi:thiamine-phosphate diphosphorylase